MPRRLAVLSLLAIVAPVSLAAQVARPAAPKRAAAPAVTPAVVDTALTTLPAAFPAATFAVLARHLADGSPAEGFYAIRLPAGGICEDHPPKPSYDESKGAVLVRMDGGHAWSTPGIEVLCSRQFTGAMTVKPAAGESYRATVIVERAQFVLPADADLRWQSHFDVSIPTTAAESASLIKRLAYYLVVKPVPVGAPAIVQRDSTVEQPTADRPDHTTTVHERIGTASTWLWVVDAPSGKVLAKGPLLPGSCP